jgi:hypothetical protein
MAHPLTELARTAASGRSVIDVYNDVTNLISSPKLAGQDCHVTFEGKTINATPNRP